jgi:hypothetical protein
MIQLSSAVAETMIMKSAVIGCLGHITLCLEKRHQTARSRSGRELNEKPSPVYSSPQLARSLDSRMECSQTASNGTRRQTERSRSHLAASPQ